MPETSVDQLREQLRQLGYLSHGIERWYQHDPWRSRTFWSELLLLAVKNAFLLFAFLAAPLAAITIWRNWPTDFRDAAILFGLYSVSAFLAITLLTLLVSALVRLRAGTIVERPGLATVVSALVSAVAAMALVVWWRGFLHPPAPTELAVGGLLIVVFLLVSTISMSAALLSLSIWSVRRVPPEPRHSQQRILLIAAGTLGVALLLPSVLRTEAIDAAQPQQIVTTPRTGKLALIAVDGLSHEMAVQEKFSSITGSLHAVPAPPPSAPPEVWATIGTGVPPFIHGVRAIEGVRVRGSGNVLQAVSRDDFVLRQVGPAIGLTSREALPPTARNRHYIWETLGARGVSSAAVNWWASDDVDAPLLLTDGQASVFAEAAKGADNRVDLALNIDRVAMARARAAIERQAQFVTLYLPALDVLHHRLPLDHGRAITRSAGLTRNIGVFATELRQRGFDLVIVGLPGRSTEKAVVASTLPLARAPHLADLAPTILDFFGFPASAEMTGSSLFEGSSQQRIQTYGNRESGPVRTKPSDEYFENLKSLGYITP